jgi:hypothetical protein
LFPFVFPIAPCRRVNFYGSLSLVRLCLCVRITVHRDAISSTHRTVWVFVVVSILEFTRSGRRRFSLTLDYYYLRFVLIDLPPPFCVCLLLVCYLGVWCYRYAVFPANHQRGPRSDFMSSIMLGIVFVLGRLIVCQVEFHAVSRATTSNESFQAQYRK